MNRPLLCLLVHPPIRKEGRNCSKLTCGGICFCFILPWHPRDETAKELLSQSLSKTASSQRSLVNDHSTVEQVRAVGCRKNSQWDRIHRNSSWTKSQTTLLLPENAHRSISRHLHVGFVHKHSLEAGVRVAARQDLLVKLKDLVQERHGVFEQRQQLRQAEVCHLSRNGR